MSLPLPVRLENLKDRISIIKEKIRYRLFKSQMAKKTPRAKVPDSERETSKKVSSLVIAVSGTIPGRTHASIEEMIKDLGARFEKLDMNNCTHLVTTKGQVEDNRNNPRTQKVRDAINSESCEIVSIGWLLRTAEEKKVVDATKHRLWEPEARKKSEDQADSNIQVKSKRKRAEVDAEDVAEESRRFDSREFPFLSSLVDEGFAEDKKDLAVYKDADGVIWDATLLKPWKNKTAIHGVETLRIQLLRNFKSKKSAIWYHKKDKGSEKTKPGRAKWGTLRAALLDFEESFMEASGLEWKDRHKQPQADKFLLITCLSRNEMTSTVDADVRILPSETICDVLFNMVVRVQSQDQITAVLTSLSNPVRAMKLSERDLRLGFSVLAKMSEILSTGDQSQVQSHLSLLGRCYRGVFKCAALPNHQGAQFPWSDGEFEWVQKEREHLTFFKNLSTIQGMLQATKTPSRQQQSAQELYQILGLNRIDIVGTKSPEFLALAEYFNGSFGTPHTKARIMQVLRIERSGEADRFDRFQKDNKHRVGTRRLLWHGAPGHNFVGLLAQGFRTNVLNCHAADDTHQGIYFADFVGKSVGYCRIAHGVALMLLCEVELGKNSWEDQHSQYFNGFRTSLNGTECISVLCQGRNQFIKWTDARCIHEDLTGVLLPDIEGGRKRIDGIASLHHNEYIVFNPAQIRQRYLLQIKIG